MLDIYILICYYNKKGAELKVLISKAGTKECSVYEYDHSILIKDLDDSMDLSMREALKAEKRGALSAVMESIADKIWEYSLDNTDVSVALVYGSEEDVNNHLTSMI